MENYYKTFEQPLEPKELKKLKRGFIFIPIFTLLFGAFFFFLFNQMEHGGGFKWVVYGFAAFFGLIILTILRGFALDLRDQTKEVFQGLITRKVRRRSKSKKGRNTTSYYFYFGDKSMKVELNLYNKFQEADLIEIHRSKRLYNMIYDSKLIKSGVMKEEVAELKRAQEEKENRIGIIVLIAVLIIVGIVVTILLT